MDLLAAWLDQVGTTLDLMTAALKTSYNQYGYLIVFFGALVENTIFLGFVWPGATLVLLGAVYARFGTLLLPLVLLMGWAGMLGGTIVDYALGRFATEGMRRTRLWRRTEPWTERSLRLLEKYGMLAIVLSHFMGNLRSFMAITCGASRLPFRRFLLFQAIAGILWNGVYVSLGYALAANIELVESLPRRIGAGVVVTLVVVLLALWIYRRVRRNRNQSSLQA